MASGTTYYSIGKPLWPLRPPPQPGELLTSWFSRLAEANGIKPIELLAYLRNKLVSNMGSRAINHDDLILLSLTTGQTVKVLKLGSIEEDDLRPYYTFYWTAVKGTLSSFKNKLNYNMLFFCPLCLLNDEVPYFRREWLLYTHVFCLKHNIMLEHRCGSCGRSVGISGFKSFTKILNCEICSSPIYRYSVLEYVCKDKDYQAVNDLMLAKIDDDNALKHYRGIIEDKTLTTLSACYFWSNLIRTQLEYIVVNCGTNNISDADLPLSSRYRYAILKDSLVIASLLRKYDEHKVARFTKNYISAIIHDLESYQEMLSTSTLVKLIAEEIVLYFDESESFM